MHLFILFPWEEFSHPINFSLSDYHLLFKLEKEHTYYTHIISLVVWVRNSLRSSINFIKSNILPCSRFDSSLNAELIEIYYSSKPKKKERKSQLYDTLNRNSNVTPRKRLSVERGDNSATEINSTLPVDTSFIPSSSRPIGMLHRANTGRWGRTMNPDKRGNFTVTRRKTSGALHAGNSRNGVTRSRGRVGFTLH